MNARVVGRVVVACALAAGCGRAVRMQLEPELPPCRAVLPTGSPSVRWVAPTDEGDRKKLRAWCDAVGALAVHDANRTPLQRDRALVVVSWNMAVGDGDLRLLLNEVDRRHPDADLILLLQEAYRAKTPPADCPPRKRPREGAWTQPTGRYS